MGKRHQSAFRIVVANKSDAADGKYIESIGIYNPRTQPSVVRLEADRALHWLRTGAKPSDTVRSILQEVGLWEQFHEGLKPEQLPPEKRVILRGPVDRPQTSARAAQSAEAAEAAAVEAETEAPVAEEEEVAAEEEQPEPEPAAEAEEAAEVEEEEAPEVEEEEPEEEAPEASAEPEAEEESGDDEEEEEKKED